MNQSWSVLSFPLHIKQVRRVHNNLFCHTTGLFEESKRLSTHWVHHCSYINSLSVFIKGPIFIFNVQIYLTGFHGCFGIFGAPWPLPFPHIWALMDLIRRPWLFFCSGVVQDAHNQKPITWWSSFMFSMHVVDLNLSPSECQSTLHNTKIVFFSPKSSREPPDIQHQRSLVLLQYYWQTREAANCLSKTSNILDHPIADVPLT